MRRLLTVSGLASAGLVTAAEPALAHGVGARGDLPVPLWWALYGAVAVLLFSFLALIRLWPEPRIEGSAGGVVVAGGGRAMDLIRPIGRLLGTSLFVVTIFSALQASELPAYLLFIGFWVGVPLTAAVLGDVWFLLNPFAALERLLDALDVTLVEDAPWLDRVGLYPAALMLLGFGWLELAHPDAADPDVVFAYLAVYAVVMLVGGVVFGPRFVHQADAFGRFFGLVGRMGVFQRDRDGRLALRAPLAGLAGVTARRGTAALVLVALGVTSFDGLTRTAWWEGLLGDRVGWETAGLNTLGLVAMVAIAYGAYVLAMASATDILERPREELIEMFAHSLVPIALAYGVAHYFSLLVFDGQLMVALASDPFRLGWDLFETSANRIDFTAVSTVTIAVVQIAAITIGHVAGVVLAHDRAVARFAPAAAGQSQYALLAVMVLYTVGGLILLLGA